MGDPKGILLVVTFGWEVLLLGPSPAPSSPSRYGGQKSTSEREGRERCVILRGLKGSKARKEVLFLQRRSMNSWFCSLF